MPDLFVVGVFFLLGVIVVALLDLLPEGFSFGRKLEDGEISLRPFHNLWLQTPLEDRRISRLGGDWIILQGEKEKRRGYRLDVNLKPNTPQTTVRGVGFYYSNLCLDGFTRNDYMNPKMKQYFEMVDYKTRKERQLEDQINSANYVTELAKQTVEKTLDDRTNWAHGLFRAFRSGDFGGQQGTRTRRLE